VSVQVVRKWKVDQVVRWAVEVMGLSEEDARLMPWRGRFLADATAEQVPEGMSSPGKAKLLAVLDSKDWGRGSAFSADKVIAV
jgi:hypothetical protein